MKLSITAFSIMTLRIMGLFATISINDTQHNCTHHNDTHHKGLISNIRHNNTALMLSVIMLIVIYAECRALFIVTVNVIMLNAGMLTVVAPIRSISLSHPTRPLSHPLTYGATTFSIATFSITTKGLFATLSINNT
jgi:hypothetical protein